MCKSGICEIKLKIEDDLKRDPNDFPKPSKLEKLRKIDSMCENPWAVDGGIFESIEVEGPWMDFQNRVDNVP